MGPSTVHGETSPLREASARRQRGVTYFWALLLVLFITLALGTLVNNVKSSGQRAREADLLAVGDLYRNAIRQYVASTPVGARRYPEKLDDLLRDPRYPVVRRYLRQLYPDPITGAPFVAIPAPEGGVMGVRSASHKQPLKTAGLQAETAGFVRSGTYRDWAFVYAP
ncbi:type II secretion system protein [Paraburkholderia humisilvae]|uniref:Type II secretion system protein G n=1 Tax=Paraburkholderia humisilvae TaxID=627669 RepID=A0A6J5EYE6_9BURK|nr:type II secretion system protein [Paraburkholderia humisilvae]CAB3771124.1 hypothetical protein LMG29542_06530 [Paraburkholderia humisilvae]